MTTHRIRMISLGLVAVVVSGCNHGTRPQDFRPAVSPAGATVWVLVEGDRREREGELFAVDSSGVLVLSGRLVRVRWDRLRRLDVVGLGGDFAVGPRTVSDSARRARLALVSRFPQGLHGDLLRRVLATLGQEAVDEAGATRRDGRDLDALADAAARASARYAERGDAIAAGYRRIGTDFPAMGEHWLRADALLHAAIDPDRPTMLTYVTVAGRPVLVGTGYVMTTRGDEAPRDVAGWPAEWHEHSGLVAEESGARVSDVPQEDRRAAADPGRTRVWVLHIWTGAPNPAGRYRADNWALPFVRANIRASGVADEPAGRALSLTMGGDTFLRALLTDAGLRTATNASTVDSLIGAARDDASRVADRCRASGSAGVVEMALLRSSWETLASGLVRVIGPEARHFLVSGH